LTNAEITALLERIDGNVTRIYQASAYNAVTQARLRYIRADIDALRGLLDAER
jgi:hypothetical protein